VFGNPRVQNNLCVRKRSVSVVVGNSDKGSTQVPTLKAAEGFVHGLVLLYVHRGELAY